MILGSSKKYFLGSNFFGKQLFLGQKRFIYGQNIFVVGSKNFKESKIDCWGVEK